MRVPYLWLSDLVELKSNPQQLADKLSLISIGVDKVDKYNNEAVLDLDVTYNRGDLLSMIGIARETAFIEDSQLKLPQPKVDLDKLPKLTNWRIQRDTSVCGLYAAVKLNLTPAPSPKWLTDRLLAAGLSVKNNLVDITNYVMWEYGQPFHAFDADKISGNLIQIKPAPKDGLNFRTLDGKQRLLNRGDILIWDAEKPIALGGVMGGANSEIDSHTRQVILEMALFDPYQIRRTAMRQGLFSPAANRFIHRPSRQSAYQALRRILDLLVEVAKAEVVGIIINGDFNQKSKIISLPVKQINSLLGVKISPAQASLILTKLGFKVDKLHDKLKVAPPHWRQDIAIVEDVIEEIARGWGYVHLPANPLPLSYLPHKAGFNLSADQQIKDFLTGQGAWQINSYSFYTQTQLKDLKINTKSLIQITNPVSAETKYLRTSLIPALHSYLKASLNSNYFNQDITLFEINKVYQLTNSGQVKEPLKLGITGSQTDVFNRIINNLFEYLRIDYQHLRLTPSSKGLNEITDNISQPLELTYKSQAVGWLAQVGGFWALEVDYNWLVENACFRPQPPVDTDLAPIIEDLTFEAKDQSPEAIFNLLISLKRADKRIDQMRVVDLYQKRINLRFIYLDPKKQLNAKQAAKIRRRIVSCAQQLGFNLVGKID